MHFCGGIHLQAKGAEYMGEPSVRQMHTGLGVFTEAEADSVTIRIK